MRPQLNPHPITPSGGGFTLPLTPSLDLRFLVIAVVKLTLLTVALKKNGFKQVKFSLDMYASCFVAFFIVQVGFVSYFTIRNSHA